MDSSYSARDSVAGTTGTIVAFDAGLNGVAVSKLFPNGGKVIGFNVHLLTVPSSFVAKPQFGLYRRIRPNVNTVAAGATSDVLAGYLELNATRPDGTTWTIGDVIQCPVQSFGDTDLAPGEIALVSMKQLATTGGTGVVSLEYYEFPSAAADVDALFLAANTAYAGFPKPGINAGAGTPTAAEGRVIPKAGVES